jgi:hypothetical protein
MPLNALPHNLVVLQRPAPVLVHVDAALLPIMDAVAAQAGIGSVVDRYAGEALAGDATTLHVEPALDDTDSEGSLYF